MNIGMAARRSGLNAKTLRFYEDIGLVQPDRRGNGYRDYDASDVHTLRFLKRARSLGFSVEECRRLVALYQDRDRTSADVKRITQDKLGEIDAKISELISLRRTLEHLVENCHGDDRPDCPILEEIADGSLPR
jgi:MerR family copper efflux transcriptional regulator